jgi:nitrogen fixation-related uncharacterized protein
MTKSKRPQSVSNDTQCETRRALAWGIAAALVCLAIVPTAFASHLSGGEPDLIALVAGVGLVLAFVGILHLLDLGLVHGGRGRKLGWMLIASSLLVVLAGAAFIIWQQAADRAAHADQVVSTTPPDFWIKSILPLIGVAVIASFGAAAAIWWASRTGQFSEAEDIKYRMLRDDDK